jgi:hypothetical protein
VAAETLSRHMDEFSRLKPDNATATIRNEGDESPLDPACCKILSASLISCFFPEEVLIVRKLENQTVFLSPFLKTPA